MHVRKLRVVGCASVPAFDVFVAVQSWMQYKMLADASGVELVRNTYAHDESLLAWSPIGTAA